MDIHLVRILLAHILLDLILIQDVLTVVCIKSLIVKKNINKLLFIDY